jgi:hypothetical protein
MLCLATGPTPGSRHLAETILSLERSEVRDATAKMAEGLE